MISMYPAIFYHEKNGHYSLVFPDLNHLATCGDTMQEATEMAVDCLAGYLYSEKKTETKFPSRPPSIRLIFTVRTMRTTIILMAIYLSA